MRILGVIDSFGLGGAETQLAESLSYLAERRGHACLACSLRPELSKEATFANAVERLYLTKTSRRSLPNVVMSLRRVLRRYRPTVVYSRLPMGNGVARLATVSTRPRVRHVTGIDTVPQMYGLGYSIAHPGSVLFRYLEALGDTVVCNSDATARAMRAAGCPPHRLAVVPNGIDTERFRPAAQSDKRTPLRAICVASLRPEKGLPRLVCILAPLLRERLFELTVVGDGEGRSDLERTVRDEAVSGSVTLAGAHKDVVPLLQSADFYVSAARVEGFGISVAEAAACGLPAVVSNVPGGIAEVVKHGTTGYLAASDDDDAFRRHVHNLASSAPQRHRMGLAARAHVVANYSLPIVAHQLENVLEGG